MTERRPIPTWRYLWPLVTYTGRYYAATTFIALLTFASPLAIGLFQKAVFDDLTSRAPAASSIWVFLALMVAVSS